MGIWIPLNCDAPGDRRLGGHRLRAASAARPHRLSLECAPEVVMSSPAASYSPPAVPTPPEVIAEAVERIAPLQGLPFEDRLWLARHGEELVMQPGEILFDEGDPRGPHDPDAEGRNPRSAETQWVHGAVHRPHRPDDRPSAVLAHESRRRPGRSGNARLGSPDSQVTVSGHARGHSQHGAARGLHPARPRPRSHPHRAAGREAHGPGQTCG